MEYRTPSPPLPPADGVSLSLSIVQHNSLGSWDVFLSLMSSLSSLPSLPMIIALQDPPVRNGKLLFFSSWKCFHPPHKRPGVAFFVHPFLIASTSILPVPFPPLIFFHLIFLPRLGFLIFPFQGFALRMRIAPTYAPPPIAPSSLRTCSLLLPSPS